ncbi:hypothetical protein TWF696_003644 [Orbilia brochopaga]|uniref:Uncharacterized protein n=1 Tax=Orbilia brochopaga TaxID=3140254 RepID=A0AAV9V3V4_9PEZI
MTAQSIPSQTASSTVPTLEMQNLDLEKTRVSLADSDESTIRIPFSTRKTSQKFFFGTLIFGNILFISLIVGLAVGLSLHLQNSNSTNNSTSSSASTTAGSGQGAVLGPGSGPNRHS